MPDLTDFVPAPHVTQSWQVSKPSAKGRKGVVVSQARAAAEVGVAVLDAGGNAVDAAVAAAFALAAVEPWNSGLGGIGFALVHPAGAAQAEMVDFGPAAPSGIDPALFELTGQATQGGFGWPEVAGDLNVHGPLSFAIPSAVEGYRAMHARWGSMPMADLLQPAIALARRGLPQDWFTTVVVAGCAALLRHYPESARIYLQDGLPPVPPYRGDAPFFGLGNLPDTLERLQIAGLRDFYEGEVASAIASDTQCRGGALSFEDLQNCAARITPAAELPWRGRVLQYASGLTAGPTLARLLDHMPDLGGATPGAAWYAGTARALRGAYSERLSGMGAASPAAAEGCTTHLTVCDADGGMVALTTTLLSVMGSKLVLPTTGVLMNNGMMWFDPRPGRANSIAPGRRPLTNMCPIIMRDSAGPMLAAGASGGRRILGSVLQVMEFITGFGMDAETAAHQPRIDVSGLETMLADRRLGADVLAALRAVGPAEYAEHVAQPINFACPNFIMIRPDGLRAGISDAMSPWSAAVAQE